MIVTKTPEELSIMTEAGRKLRRVMKELVPFVTAGLTTEQVDQKADELIVREGGEAGFKKVKNYRWATCLPVNEQAVHTPPSDKVLKKGDLLTIDIGLFYKGFHTDHAVSLVVDEDNPAGDIAKFLDTGRAAVNKAIRQAKAGGYVGDISKILEDTIYGNGYFVLKQLTGHGIGRKLHEDPMIPGFLDRPVEKTLRIENGMTFAIEIIYSMGSEKIAYEKGSDWSIISADHSLAACFEHTVAFIDNRAVILT